MRESKRRSLLNIATRIALLIVCATALSNCQTTGCPPLTMYSKEFQAKAAVEIDRLPTGSPTKQLVSDYGKLRDACRVK